MKKFAIASLIALAATAASALEVGVTATRDYSGEPNRNGAGLTVGQKYGAVGVTAGFERFTNESTLGNTVLWAPLRMLTPMASTSSCKAACTTISGVWRKPV